MRYPSTIDAKNHRQKPAETGRIARTRRVVPILFDNSDKVIKLIAIKFSRQPLARRAGSANSDS
jgi:hypothetical protein